MKDLGFLISHQAPRPQPEFSTVGALRPEPRTHYHALMAETTPTLPEPSRLMRQRALAWLGVRWRIAHTSAVLLVLALSPSSYTRAHRDAIARNLVAACARNLLWSSLLSALISIVIIRIVLVTSISYGLSQYALEMLIRVLVLELIPLTAVLFVAVRIAVPSLARIASSRPERADARLLDPERLAREALPIAITTTFAVLLLATVSCVLAAVLAYFSVHGITAGGLAPFTRTFGRVFDPTVSLLFGLKTLLFALAAGMLPVASALVDRIGAAPRANVMVQALVRLLFVILLIEVASLVGNYY
jgi:phospholipid/cholesterol/gamma-HCH transport system permease protein